MEEMRANFPSKSLQRILYVEVDIIGVVMHFTDTTKEIKVQGSLLFEHGDDFQKSVQPKQPVVYKYTYIRTILGELLSDILYQL